MAKFKVRNKNLYVKNWDKVNNTLTFTENASEAYVRETGYYSRAELDAMKFHCSDNELVKDIVLTEY